MQVEIIRFYRDKELNRNVREGEVLTVSKERYKELISAGVSKKHEESPSYLNLEAKEGAYER